MRSLIKSSTQYSAINYSYICTLSPVKVFIFSSQSFCHKMSPQKKGKGLLDLFKMDFEAHNLVGTQQALHFLSQVKVYMSPLVDIIFDQDTKESLAWFNVSSLD